MKQVCGLDRDRENYAWSFDGVPEENSLYLQYGKVRVEVPSIDAVFLRPKELLGERVHARFGKEFPIRFDFLDTMEGQNLSLQVHPLTEYIQQVFGMHYTQDESYYILDAKEDAVVYLGLKEGIDQDCMGRTAWFLKSVPRLIFLLLSFGTGGGWAWTGFPGLSISSMESRSFSGIGIPHG